MMKTLKNLGIPRVIRGVGLTGPGNNTVCGNVKANVISNSIRAVEYKAPFQCFRPPREAGRGKASLALEKQGAQQGMAPRTKPIRHSLPLPHSISLFTKGNEGGRRRRLPSLRSLLPRPTLTTSKADKQTWFPELASLATGH